MNGSAVDVLEEIVARFPNAEIDFNREIFAQLEKAVLASDGKMQFHRSSDDFYPMVSLDTNSENNKVLVEFLTSRGRRQQVRVENTTGETRKNPLKYSHVNVGEIANRFNDNDIRIEGLDHVGFNLPWFSSSLHPVIEGLRHSLASKCLYHKFPTGEPWDFIILGSIDEILNLDEVDYSITRKPKFEIVSFDASSTPLVQFDVQCDKKYAEFSQVFPEAIHDDQFRNVWIYIKNQYDVDICFVLNETSTGDWSTFFKDSRISP